jgi:redox-sensitive bicupin YhaK (pirin superfamily)
MVWTQAGSGVVHEEMAATPDGDLHMVQLFVNLTREGKLAPPRVFHLEGDDVPEWCSGTGDRVRVLVGSFEDRTSPLVPTHPFRFLDVQLRREVSFDLSQGHNALAYVLSGAVTVSADDGQQRLPANTSWRCGAMGAASGSMSMRPPTCSSYPVPRFANRWSPGGRSS